MFQLPVAQRRCFPSLSTGLGISPGDLRCERDGAVSLDQPELLSATAVGAKNTFVK